ncbi:hypothetical protein AB0B63_31620 [Micromonospora sp. NPDC049081]
MANLVIRAGRCCAGADVTRVFPPAAPANATAARHPDTVTASASAR